MKVSTTPSEPTTNGARNEQLKRDKHKQTGVARAKRIMPMHDAVNHSMAPRAKLSAKGAIKVPHCKVSY